MSEHVLVVDDDPAFRGLLRAVLAEEGFASYTVG
jgi:DNA-binding response OmpR family regulator